MGKSDFRTAELCSDKESELEEWQPLGKNGNFNFIWLKMWKNVSD